MSQYVYIGKNISNKIIEATLDEYLSSLGFKLVQNLSADELNPNTTSACGYQSWGQDTAAYSEFVVGPITIADLTQAGAVGVAVSLEIGVFAAWTNTSNIDVGISMIYQLIGSTYTAGIPILEYKYTYNCSLLKTVGAMYGYDIPCY